ncbi:acyl-coenzyme A diphosphatase NUDT19-like [Saccoglossus kowalevskii]|uniref:Nucleoside diphosphate-linked moiety X motif 19, mitochondrial-like n=1 Tax=Saccoglossus kowalevskii TaxID=10224 RepID=A0ABM0GRS4_SACKO|nr:PREDICTED: nucleoside diphosphate-linked moiety X motif 19, mitochondrial-like [Saccoglossus kowalevskii]
MAAVKKPWREAATVIIAARSSDVSNYQRVSSSDFHSDQDGFKILMLKRHSKSSSFPDAYVFPGGTIDKSDFSDEWMELYDNAGLTPSLKPLLDIGGKRPDIMSTIRSSRVPNEIAFRICAIREAFEESGLLIVKPSGISKNEHGLAKWSKITQCVKKIGRRKLLQCRQRVHDNGAEFFDLCKELACVPNVWALCEWNIWLTPVGLPKRYDTIFYICCLDDVPVPQLLPDDQEIVKSTWLTPKETVNLWLSKTIRLIPPQMYEMLRLVNFRKFTGLHQFTKQRERKGIERYFPVMIIASDGVIEVYPGDSLYPMVPDPTRHSIVEVDGTMEENLHKCRNVNRIHPLESGPYCNIEPTYGHIRPVDWRTLIDVKGKL